MTDHPERDPAQYRPCVGIVLINRDGHIFIGERSDARGSWQMPQGGIDEGESVEQAAIRELGEEAGTTSAEIIAVTEGWHYYDLPPHLQKRMWKGRYKGQRQRWVLARFTGNDTDFDLAAHSQQEFSAWRWAAPENVLDSIVSFKRATYEAVLAELLPAAT
jgi:putative (di)nucleoside polyphosphate hydrolase